MSRPLSLRSAFSSFYQCCHHGWRSGGTFLKVGGHKRKTKL